MFGRHHGPSCRHKILMRHDLRVLVSATDHDGQEQRWMTRVAGSTARRSRSGIFRRRDPSSVIPARVPSPGQIAAP